MGPYYVQVILPLKLAWIPVYSSAEPLARGARVSASVAGRRYAGVVWKSVDSPDIEPSRVRPLLSVDNALPAVSDNELKLWEFISGYYLCTLGEVFKAAYPLMALQAERTELSTIERLKARAAARQEALTHRHRADITARLVRERDAALSAVSALARRPAAHAAPPPPAAKPLLLCGSRRVPRYIEEIRLCLSQGRQALLLTPDRACCDIIASSLREEFGERMHTITSSKTPAQRRLAARDLRSGAPVVILGTRAAVFLPFSALGLIMADEEQDVFHKQTEPAPRYNARDVAVTLASIHGAKVILGAEVPSLESVYNCTAGRYDIERTDRPAPCPLLVDITAERRKNGMLSDFSRKLIEEIHRCEGRVVLLRGWENPETLRQEAEELFPGREIGIMSYAELRRDGCAGVQLLAVMQADALVSRDDFRADERALQIIASLGSLCQRLVIQTAVVSRFDGSRSAAQLLKERQDFGFPPFTRIVDVRRSGGSSAEAALVSRHFLPRDRTLARRKRDILASLPKGCYVDVDPV